jgi:hypothetical protein
MITSIDNNFNYKIADSQMFIYKNNKGFKFDCTNISNTELLLLVPPLGGKLLSIPSTAPSNYDVLLYNDNNYDMGKLPSVQFFVSNSTGQSFTNSNINISCDTTHYDINTTGSTGNWNTTYYNIPVSGIYTFSTNALIQNNSSNMSALLFMNGSTISSSDAQTNISINKLLPSEIQNVTLSLTGQYMQNDRIRTSACISDSSILIQNINFTGTLVRICNVI